MSFVFVGMEERAIQRAEQKKKIEAAKQQKTEEKLVREAENGSVFHITPVTRNAYLTPESGTLKRSFIQSRSFMTCEKANVHQTSKEVSAAFEAPALLYH